MKIPKKVMVLGEVYTVRYVKGLSESRGFIGLADPISYTISLDPSLKSSPRALKRVFLHELAHCFSFEAGLSDFMSRDAQEMFAQAFSGFMCQFKV